jgi:hypothetical protein
VKKLNEFKKEPEVPILDKEKQGDNLSFGDHEIIFFGTIP